MPVERVKCQPIDDENTVIQHPAWPHGHLVWMPIWLAGDNALDMDRQQELYTGIAMRACEGTGLARHALDWRKPWVMSFPARDVE